MGIKHSKALQVLQMLAMSLWAFWDPPNPLCVSCLNIDLTCPLGWFQERKATWGPLQFEATGAKSRTGLSDTKGKVLSSCVRTGCVGYIGGQLLPL